MQNIRSSGNNLIAKFFFCFVILILTSSNTFAAVTVTEFNNINNSCLTGPSGIATKLYRATMVHVNSSSLFLFDKRARHENLGLRWDLTSRVYNNRPVGYNAHFELQHKLLYFCAELRFGKNLCLASSDRFPYVKFNDFKPQYDRLGYLLEDQSMVDGLEVANEDVPDMMVFRNISGGPTELEFSTAELKTCLHKALEQIQ